MDFDESADEAAFRAEVRGWFTRPDVQREVRNFNGLTPDDDLDWVAVAKVWQRFLADEGWACITWPVEYGGRGGSTTQAAIFAEESARVGAFGATFAVGLSMAGPTIIAHGTDEQKRRYLPPMLRGDEVWCQLFSEPGAGSDLAGLSTRAVRDGDEWVVDGQKVWTSGAHFSDWGILLTRTDRDRPKHRGITYFLLDMRTTGIEVRPLRQITGAAHFNEVFLTGVRIPHANVLGEVNGGWAVTMTTLANERTFMGSHSRSLGYADLAALARDQRGGRSRGHPAGNRGIVQPRAAGALHEHACADADQPRSPAGTRGVDCQARCRLELETQRRARAGPRGRCRHVERGRRAGRRRLATVVPRRAGHPHRGWKRRDPAQRHRRAGARAAR